MYYRFATKDLGVMSVPVVPSAEGRNVLSASPGSRGANSSFTGSPHLVSQPQVKKIVQDIHGVCDLNEVLYII